MVVQTTLTNIVKFGQGTNGQSEVCFGGVEFGDISSDLLHHFLSLLGLGFDVIDFLEESLNMRKNSDKRLTKIDCWACPNCSLPFAPALLCWLISVIICSSILWCK